MAQNNRQLAAVMFTDMVGYTEMMEQNEDEARTSRDRHRKVLERLVGENQGSILQYFGDGTLTVFDSAIQAVNCALEIQTEFQQTPKIPVRIGLHVGDIVYEESGVYGDAVNVASRIEAISVPGGVLFSERVFDDIKNHPRFHSNSLGAFTFKNVNRPIEVFALSNPLLAVPAAGDLEGKTPVAIQRVAVLPFVSMSGDPDNEFFSDGMTEELITAFTKVDGLNVMSRTSSFAFKGKNMDVREIGSQLKVDTILEGSVRKAGNRVRITAQLINTADGYHLFSETYDRDLEDIFAIQDEIALKITEKLTSQLSGGSGNGKKKDNIGQKPKHLVKTLTKNLDAYSIYLKGLFYWNKFTPANTRKAVEYFEEAVSMDPEFGAAYAWLANCYGVLGSTGTLLPVTAFPKAEEYAGKALELDDELAVAHVANGIRKLIYEWDCSGAGQAFEKALKMNPGSGFVRKAYAMYLQAWGKRDEAIREMELAARLDPLSPLIKNHLAYCYFCVERYDDAFREIDKALELDPEHYLTTDLKGWCFLMLGEYDKAIETFLRCRELADGDERGVASLGYAYARVGRKEDALQCLEILEERRKQGRPELLDMDFVTLYTGLRDFDKAFYHLRRLIDARLGGAMFVRAHPAYKELRDNPRYIPMMDSVRELCKA
ncbi:MAG: guanylate cyclase [bacterium]|nr:guanylate cyclase [bacterium]